MGTKSIDDEIRWEDAAAVLLGKRGGFWRGLWLRLRRVGAHR